GGSCNFDMKQPNLAALVQAQYGPTGPAGPMGQTGPPGGSTSFPGITSDGSNGLNVVGSLKSGSATSGRTQLGTAVIDRVCTYSTSDSGLIASDIAALSSSGGTLRLHGYCDLTGTGPALITIPANATIKVDCGSWGDATLIVDPTVSN